MNKIGLISHLYNYIGTGDTVPEVSEGGRGQSDCELPQGRPQSVQKAGVTIDILTLLA